MNTNIYWFFVNIKYMATCFDQSLVIFMPGNDIKITTQN